MSLSLSRAAIHAADSQDRPYLVNSVAHPHKRDVDASYVELVELALAGGGYAAVATHDEKIVEHVMALAESRGLPKRGRFEFQMLYGIAAPLARRVLERGVAHRVRDHRRHTVRRDPRAFPRLRDGPFVEAEQPPSLSSPFKARNSGHSFRALLS